MGVASPDYEWFQPSIQHSGAIVKDKLWYRFSHAYVSREDPVNVIHSVELTTRTQSLNADQITWQVSPKNKLAFQFQADRLTLENLDPSSAVRLEASQTLEASGPIYTLSWTAPYSAHLIVDSRVAYQNQRVDLVPTVAGAEQDCMIFPTFVAFNRTRCLDIDTNVVSGSHPETSSDRRQRLSVRSDATWYHPRLLGSSHRVKFGFITENERYYRELERRPEIVQFFRVRPFFPPPPIYGVALTSISVPRTSSGRATGVSWAVYLEDQLKPAPNVAITFGLRVDREEIRSRGYLPFDPEEESLEFLREVDESGLCQVLPQSACAALIAPGVFTAYEGITELRIGLAEAMEVDPRELSFGNNAQQLTFWHRIRKAGDIDLANTNFSPRLSVAWDPWSDGRTKLASSFGRYYDKIFLGVPLLEFEPIRTGLTFFGVPEPGTFEPLISIGLFDTIDPAVTTQLVDRNLSTPYQDEFTLSFERGLGREASTKVTYVRRRFRDQLQDRDINHLNGITRNPGWGEILLVGNFNTTEYEAYVLELVRRQHRGWQMNASYTWSEARGDAEDFTQELGNVNNRSLQGTERGYLSYDQRHAIRFSATATGPRGYRVGTVLRWESGLPYSVIEDAYFPYDSLPEYGGLGISGGQSGFSYPTGERNDQRNESFWNVDGRVAKEFKLGRAASLQVTAEVFNLLDDDALRQKDRLNGINAGVRRFGRRFQVGLRAAF